MVVDNWVQVVDYTRPLIVYYYQNNFDDFAWHTGWFYHDWLPYNDLAFVKPNFACLMIPPETWDCN